MDGSKEYYRQHLLNTLALAAKQITYKWITLCESRQKLFCFICRNEHNKDALMISKNAESAFTSDGFDN